MGMFPIGTSFKSVENGKIKKRPGQFLNPLKMSSTQASDSAYTQDFPSVGMITHTIQQLQLRERQVGHYQHTSKILNSFYFYVDGSEMGTGKTFIAAAHAIMRHLPVLIICPVAARQNWLDVCAMYGVSMYNLPETGGVITYDTLRSRKSHQPKHGLLYRDDSGETPLFFATTLFTQIVRAGVLVIFDECQKLKNTSDQYRAAKALMRQFYTVGGISRAGFLSGTAMDKPEQAVNFLRLVGFIEQRNLYSKVRGEVRLEGVEDLHRWARRVNPDALDRFMAIHPFKSTRQGAIDYVFQLFTDVIKPGVMSIMPSLHLDKCVKNGYYQLEPEDQEEYRCAISDLANAVRYNPVTDTVMRTKDNMGAITTAQIRSQNAKKRTMARKARQDLLHNPNCKVILYADYYEVIESLLVSLAEFNPVELTGRITEARRNDNISRFQEQNLNCRLLIGNPLVGGMCVNLHDITGLFPRSMYIMPGYRINELHQATGRTARDGLIGSAIIRFFYGVSGSRENNILNALARKGEVMQKVHAEQGARFPNEYEDEREEGAESPSEIPITNHFCHTEDFSEFTEDGITQDELEMIARTTGLMNNLSLDTPVGSLPINMTTQITPITSTDVDVDVESLPTVRQEVTATYNLPNV